MSSFSVVNLAVNDVFHGLHGFRFIDIHKLPVAHNPFPVYGMNHDQVGSFPDLERTREVMNTEGFCPVDRGHS